MEALPVAFVIVFVIFVVGAWVVTGKAQENTKDPVSGGLGGCAILLWIVGIGFVLYSMAAVMATGGN